MASLSYLPNAQAFIFKGTFEERIHPRDSGFSWHPEKRMWYTPDRFAALKLLRFADASAKLILDPLAENIAASAAIASDLEIPMPAGITLYPHQKAGVAYLARFKAAFCADLPGSGKTLQTVALANHLGLRRVLIVCPAGLRGTWEAEYRRGSIFKPRICTVYESTSPFDGDVVIISYDLAVKRFRELMAREYDLLVVDEAHYCKERRAKRTQAVIGAGKTLGFLSRAGRVVFLSGTPIPNKAPEFWAILRQAAPSLIGRMGYWDFAYQYAHVTKTPWGPKVSGSRNAEQLGQLLRSGFMLRREREAILPNLPEKTHKLVVLPAGGKFTHILERERAFDPEEIAEHGIPIGSPLPELRRAMGEAKAPQAAMYVLDLLEDADEKILVFAHHRSVVAALAGQLAAYYPVTITGDTPAIKREEAVTAFQTDPNTRVMIANIQAGGVGLTLTAARQVVFAEVSFVPGENEQAQDRVYRIGQTRGVVIHWPVVQGSLDAKILKLAVDKQEALSAVMRSPGLTGGTSAPG